jgi:hypothetical protein
LLMRAALDPMPPLAPAQKFAVLGDHFADFAQRYL